MIKFNHCLPDIVDLQIDPRFPGEPFCFTLWEDSQISEGWVIRFGALKLFWEYRKS